ncbi:MAG: methionyl-tRNA formyltransferase [Candidatus Nomurabacteria bacterium]|nr:methionyl-tRNA formyltransferase [Candidatus Nomurabacteria bacterium]
MSNISFAFFGTGALAESTLATLVRNGFTPKLIVTKPDSPQGRHMVMTSPHIKTWADMKGITVFQPEDLKSIPSDSLLHNEKFDLFIVASYGKIIPENILSIPEHGSLNVHPSLLPEYRGPSPIESALLDGKITTGVTIIKLDNEMDHGPILAQIAFPIDTEATAGTLEVTCGQIGGDLLSQVITPYIEGNLIPKEQDHSKATVCRKLEKSMGEITLEDSGENVIRKYKALTPWPGIYFFHIHKDKKIRVKITKVDLSGRLEGISTAKNIILSVIPEGKHEMSWEDFTRGYMKD